MIKLLQAWKESLLVFLPRSFVSSSKQVALCAARGCRLFIKQFLLIVAMDIVFFLVFQQSIISLFESFATSPMEVITAGQVFLRLIYAVLQFIITGGLLLALRKDSSFAEKGYFWQGFINLILLSLFGSFVFSFALLITMQLGIKVFPQIPFPLMIIWNVVGLLCVFYWLDLKFRMKVVVISEETSFIVVYFRTMFRYFKDALIAFERALNLVLYNAPFFIIVMICGFFLNRLITTFLFNSPNIFIFEEQSFLFKGTEMLTQATTQISLITYALAKYGKLLINYGWVSLFFVFYRSRRDIIYTPPFFK